MNRGTAIKVKLFMVPQAADIKRLTPGIPHNTTAKLILIKANPKEIGNPISSEINNVINISIGVKFI